MSNQLTIRDYMSAPVALNEVWLPIPNYEDLYMASNFGRVKSVDRYVKRSRGGLQIARSKILKQNMSGQYLAVALSKDGKPRTRRVHKLVALAYLREIPKGLVINHLDGNKLNNSTSNLQLTTQQANIDHAIAMGLSNNRGDNHYKRRNKGAAS